MMRFRRWNRREGAQVARDQGVQFLVHSQFACWFLTCEVGCKNVEVLLVRT